MHNHLEKYFGRFRSLLGAGNQRYIQTLMVLTRAFLQVLLKEEELDVGRDAEKAAGTKVTFDSSMAINEFLFSLNIDNINLVKLVRYIKESNIIHKVSVFSIYFTIVTSSLEFLSFIFSM